MSEQSNNDVSNNTDNNDFLDNAWEAKLAVFKHIFINFFLVGMLLGTQFFLKSSQFSEKKDLIFFVFSNSLDFIGVTIFLLIAFLLNDHEKIKDKKTRAKTIMSSWFLLLTSLLYYPFFANFDVKTIEKNSMVKVIFNQTLADNSLILCQIMDNSSHMGYSIVGFCIQIVIFLPALLITSYSTYIISYNRW